MELTDKIEVKALQSIYRKYGFEVTVPYENLVCCSYKKTRYFGIDIIPLVELPEVIEKAAQLQEQYSRSGYAANVRQFSTIVDVENELFKSFFSFDSTISRLSRKYSDFVSKQTKQLLGNPYEYIESPYEFYDGRERDQNLSLLENVKALLEGKSPQLLIIEAAAGYGKTCAAYEILKLLISEPQLVRTPLFTELSKNRGAKIFRYILLDEIDLEFPTLNSELVTFEIKSGRIPLIIDGFDELLDKVNASDINLSKAFEEIETMLDTIGNLLDTNAKIILTTRKTAIFTGTEFDSWYQKWNNKFSVTRFSLKEPRIKDWLGQERFKQIKDQNVPIQYIANPVLLTYLKNIDADSFSLQLQNTDLLIKQYFDRMLERERERQNLIITKDKQYEIFKNVARMLLDFDITVESKEFFKEIIKEQNNKLLEYTRTLYTGQEKPTIENLLDTLATHALLDRKGRDESQIGFINDFVLGIFVGEIICETSVEKIEKDYSYYMLDLACTAFKVHNKKTKKELWEKVNLVTHKLQPISVFKYDITLKEALVRNYTELSVYDTTFFHVSFEGHNIENSVFLNCYFKDCAFNTDYFAGVSFVDCVFDQCRVTNVEYLDSAQGISTIKCTVKDCQILEFYEYHHVDDARQFTDMERTILRRIWTISGTRSHHIVQLLRFFDKSQHKLVIRTLGDLLNKEFIQMLGNHLTFNINRLPIIKAELN